MQNKKIILISGIVILLVAAGAFAFAFLKSKNSQNNNQQQQQNPGQNSTSTGSVTQTQPPAQQGFNISQNPSQPYTNLRPRQGTTDQVAVQPPPVLNPQQPGNKTTPTIGADDITNPDYSNLNDSQFLSKFYPSSGGLLSGQNDPATQQLNAQDPVLIDNSPQASITVNPNVSASLFKVTKNTDQQSDLNYVTQLSNSTSKFDIVNNPNLFTDAVNDPTQINSSKAQAQSQISAIESIPVPENMLGMSQDYVAYYQAYIQFMTDFQTSFTGNESDAVVNKQAARLQDDMNSLTSRLSQVNSDIINAQQILQ